MLTTSLHIAQSFVSSKTLGQISSVSLRLFGVQIFASGKKLAHAKSKLLQTSLQTTSPPSKYDKRGRGGSYVISTQVFLKTIFH